MNKNAGEPVRLEPPLAVLRQCPLGWVIDLQDANGVHILSSAAYGSKFLAEEALAKILERQVRPN